MQTPLMIVGVDFDNINMPNVEISFSALVQQRKPAQFVRYWSEGHGMHTPANDLDRYQCIFA